MNLLYCTYSRQPKNWYILLFSSQSGQNYTRQIRKLSSGSSRVRLACEGEKTDITACTNFHGRVSTHQVSTSSWVRFRRSSTHSCAKFCQIWPSTFILTFDPIISNQTYSLKKVLMWFYYIFEHKQVIAKG